MPEQMQVYQHGKINRSKIIWDENEKSILYYDGLRYSDACRM